MTPETMEKWDLRFMRLAQHIAGWSKDPSTQVGCVVVDAQRRIVSTGYNGLPRGVPDAPEYLNDRDTKLKVVIHAERNALLFATQPLEGCTLYVWPFMPCAACASMIIQSGIKRVVAPQREGIERWRIEFVLAEKLFRAANVHYEGWLFPELEAPSAPVS